MTTDLTGGSDLGEEEFDWDVFAPDPDESEIAAEAAALEDQAALNLDDSDLDWEAALQEPEALGGAEGEARAGAAFDRIVDTVRRSVEDPETEGGDVDEIVATPEPEAAAAATGLAWLDVDDEADPDDLAESEAVHELPGADAVNEATVAVSPAAFEPAADVAPWAEPDLSLSQEAAWEPRPDPVPHQVPTFEPEAAALVAPSTEPAWTTAPEPEPELEPEAAPLSASALPEPGDDAAEGPMPRSKKARSEKARSKKHGERQPRSRVFTATVVLACLVLVIVAGVVAVRSLHRAANPAPSAAAPPHAAPRVSPSPDAARMQSATDAVDSATTAAQVGLTSLSTFPTTSNVAKVIYPYISSLQLYESFLASSTVPAPARAAAASATRQVHQELTFLDTISALPPEQLGAYLQQFGTDATRLQSTLSALEHDLSAPTS